MRDHLRQELAIAVPTMAIQRQRPGNDPGRGLIHHSDRGSQDAAGDYRAVLKASGIVPSMGRKGDCRDNAPMESRFHTLRDEARRDLFAYIETYYNRERLHSAPGYRTPERAERQAA